MFNRFAFFFHLSSNLSVLHVIDKDDGHLETEFLSDIFLPPNIQKFTEFGTSQVCLNT